VTRISYEQSCKRRAAQLREKEALVEQFANRCCAAPQYYFLDVFAQIAAQDTAR